ncbi:hypothetical protein T484DRAFT_1808899 [Baffinella frigidus]|nr:hypothetical protein T484DRAFT_1808899 [Cryptophyta sp. CCMP2293]
MKMHVRVTALANDTVGTMMAKKLTDPRAEVGIIFGTGTNACYIEQARPCPPPLPSFSFFFSFVFSFSFSFVFSFSFFCSFFFFFFFSTTTTLRVKNIVKMQGGSIASERMCINMEWGNFGKGAVDERVDTASP